MFLAARVRHSGTSFVFFSVVVAAAAFFWEFIVEKKLSFFFGSILCVSFASLNDQSDQKMQ